MKTASLLSILLIIVLMAGSAVVFSPPVVQEEVLILNGTRAIEPGTVVDHDINSDTTWTVLGSPYRVKINVTVEEGVNLTIEPDVEVLMYKGNTLSVDGTIYAVGEPFKIIEFKPVSDPPGTGDWAGINFLANSTNCILQKVKLSYAEGAINCTEGTSPVIRDSTIFSSYYYGISCGEYSTPLIENCFVNVSTWSGILCNNLSEPQVRDNTVEWCYYGIVCYSSSKIEGNTVSDCAFGISTWNGSEAHDFDNDIDHCIDGIFVYFSNPVIENNTIISTSGNGTSFIESDAQFLNNTLTFNDAGVDSPYDSRWIIETMSGNTVNGIDVAEFYRLGLQDALISDLYFDSGASQGYHGLPTAQGSITLYDCSNVTLENITVENAMNSIYAVNSPLISIYHSEFNTSRRADLHLDHMSSVRSYNGSVDHERVHIEDPGSYMVSYGKLRVKVNNYTDFPVEGAVVEVRELSTAHFNVTTNGTGLTQKMLVKEKRVSDSGVLNYSMTVEVWNPGMTFDDNPRNVQMGEFVEVTFTDLGDLVPPVINGTNLENGQQGVAVNTQIIVSFSEKMNKTSVEEAFTISNNVSGTFSWDANDLVFTPAGNPTDNSFIFSLILFNTLSGFSP